MIIRLALFYILLFSLALISCKEENNTKSRQLSLDPSYLRIEKIKSFANCNGPNGDYTTEVISEKNGGLFFSQAYTYRDQPFTAKLSADNKGYIIDENGEISDSLSTISIEMIRSHDFHRLQTNPKSFFDKIKFEKDVETEIELYSGIDRLDNPVKIYFDKTVKQIRSVEFLNMMDTTEVIQVEYKKWVESEYGKLAKEIEIVQAKKDTFHFDFKTIEINNTTSYSIKSE